MVLFPATCAAVLLAFACAWEWSSSASDLPAVATGEPESLQIQSPPPKPEPKFHSSFESPDGKYKLPIAWSTDAVIEGVGGDEVKWAFVRDHSAEELWTRVFAPLDRKKPTLLSAEPGDGWDKFVRYFGEHVAQLRITWVPKPVGSLAKDFRQAITFHKQAGVWIPGSEKPIRIGGFKAMSGRFMASAPNRIMYGTFALVHVGQRSYQIQFSYTDGFTDPEMTFEKVMQLRFDPPDGKPLAAAGL